MKIKFIFNDDKEVLIPLENSLNFSIREEGEETQEGFSTLKVFSLEFLSENASEEFINLSKKIKVKEIQVLNEDIIIEQSYANSYISAFLQTTTKNQFIRKVQLILE